jgi:DNA-binding CsgD family transcriptional regulator
MRNRVAWLSQRAAAFENGVELLPVAIVLIGAAGDLLHANLRARTLLAARDGLRSEGGRLFVMDRAAHTRYESALACVREGRPELAAPFRVPRPSMLRPFQMFASPSRDTLGPGSSAALVWIHDPEDTPVPSHGALQELFGLTPAESRMAASIASGSTVSAYAAEAGVTEETARFRLKQVLAKTGVHRQADLVRIVLSSLPALF